MTVPTIFPADAHAMLAAGATLIDIRDADAFAREHIAGAVNRPLADIGRHPLPTGPIIFHCQSGMRTTAHADALAAAAGAARCVLLQDGIDGWRGGGLPTIRDRRQPLEIMRQVQLGAGALALLGVLLGWLIHPALFSVSAFVGAGLMVAGATGWCGMARLLRIMPWNKTRPLPS